MAIPVSPTSAIFSPFFTAAPELTVLTCTETADGLRLHCHVRLGEAEAEARVLLQDGKIAGALLL